MDQNAVSPDSSSVHQGTLPLTKRRTLWTLWKSKRKKKKEEEEEEERKTLVSNPLALLFHCNRIDPRYKAQLIYVLFWLSTKFAIYRRPA